MDFIGGLPPERIIIMKIMTQDKTRVLNFKMTYISYVSKNRICEGDFGIAEYASPERAKEVLNDMFQKYAAGEKVSSTVSSAIDNVLKRLRQQGIEIERFTHHAFRDTFATRYIEEGGNMQTLQKILGHSSLAMTADLYAHVLPNTKQQEMQQIENGFIGVAVL